MKKSQRNQGFTLLELMVVVAIVAILGTIALPAYQDSIRKGRRADAMTSLLQIQMSQEKWRANNPTYSNSLSSIGWSGTNSLEGYYTVAITASSATTFTATATPKSGGPQVGDSCGTFTITANGPDTSTTAKKKCWSK